MPMTFQVVIGSLAALGTLVAAFTRVWPLLNDHRARRALRATSSIPLYDLDAIRKATHRYTTPDCRDTDSDEPTRGAERRNLFEFVDAFLDDREGKRHLLILGDSGVGKSSFVLNYVARHLLTGRNRRIAAVPMCDGRVDDALAAVQDKRSTILFLDGFDEDAHALVDYKVRFQQLMEICRDFYRVIVTSRSQFFLSDAAVPNQTGIVLTGPRHLTTPGTFALTQVYIAPFDERQIRSYLSRLYPIWRIRKRRRALRLAKRVPQLAARPMLLAHLDDLMQREPGIETTYELYEAMIDGWLNREASASVRPPWSSLGDKWQSDTPYRKQQLRFFCTQLAIHLAANPKKYTGERIAAADLVQLARGWGISLEDWQLRVRSLLNRDPLGNYKFSHRSIMEFLVAASWLANDPGARAIPMSAGVRLFVQEMLHSSGKRGDAKAFSAKRAYAGANLTGESFWHRDLTGYDFSGANLAEADLSRSDLSNANLSGCILTDANLEGADLGNANLSGSDLSGTRLAGTSLWQTNFDEAQLSGAHFRGARLWRTELARSKNACAGQLALAATLYKARLPEGLHEDLRRTAPSVLCLPITESPSFSSRRSTENTPSIGVRRNAMTINVEEFFHLSSVEHVWPRWAWNDWQPRIEPAVERVLDVLEKCETLGTFFILGWVAERHPRLVRRIASCGHEIASLGYARRRAYLQTKAEFLTDTRRAKDLLEDILSERVAGFRAPGFSISGMNLWVFEALVEAGHTYDSSVFPVAHDRYGVPNAPRFPFVARFGDARILEFPLMTRVWSGVRVPHGSGEYFRAFPYWMTRSAVEHLNGIENHSAVFSFRPWEFDPDTPRIGLPLGLKVRIYNGLGRSEARLCRLLGDFPFTSIRELVPEYSQRTLEEPVKGPDIAHVAENSKYF
jgi:polysaccharide deacetylase family protein (PEP-CTERM system associated)